MAQVYAGVVHGSGRGQSWGVWGDRNGDIAQPARSPVPDRPSAKTQRNPEKFYVSSTNSPDGPTSRPWGATPVHGVRDRAMAPV